MGSANVFLEYIVATHIVAQVFIDMHGTCV